MSVQSEIDRIKQNVDETYSALAEKGATMPAEQNSDNLAATARTVPQSSEGGGEGAATAAKAVLYTEQTLTDEQKAQARANIGAAAEGEGGSTVEVDTTLTKSGAAADAKVVGNKLANDESFLETLHIFNLMESSPSLKWDGNIDGREKIILAEDAESAGYLVRISDEVPNFPASYAYIGAVQDGTTVAAPAPVFSMGDTGCFILGDMTFVVPYDNVDVEGIVFPKKGIWTFCAAFNGIPISYMSRLYIPGYSFKQSTGEVAPGVTSWNDLEDRPFGSYTNTDKITWDGNNPDGTDAVLVSRSTPTIADFANGCIISATSNGVTEELEIPPDWIVEQDDGAIIISGNDPNGEPIIFPLAAVDPDGVYFVDFRYGDPISFDSYTNGLTIPGYSGFSYTKKIDNKYLPETMTLYVNMSGSDAGLYKNPKCTLRATRDDVSDISSFVIDAYANGVKAGSLNPVAVDLSNDYATVIVTNPSGNNALYTSEYFA